MGRHIRDISALGDDIVAAGIASATRIATRRGYVAAGDLRAGDAVLTRDGGYRSLSRITPLGLMTCVAPGEGRLRLRPDHGVLQRAGPWEEEVLIPAIRLTGFGMTGLFRATVLALHLDRHEILLAEGGWIESQPGADDPARPRQAEVPRAAPLRKFRVAAAARDA